MFYGRMEAQELMIDAAGDDWDPADIAEIARLDTIGTSKVDEYRQYDTLDETMVT